MATEHEKELVARRQSAWEAAKAIIEGAESEDRGLTAEEEQSYQRAMSDMDGLKERLDRLADVAKRDADVAAAFDALPEAKRDAPGPQDDGLAAFLRGEARSYVANIGRQELRDLTKGTAASGGATLPTSFSGYLWAHLIETATVAGISTVINTDSGENFEMPVTTSHSSGSAISENSTVTESDPAFAKRTLGAYKFGVAIQAPTELLQDTGVDLEGYLAMQAGRAVGNAFGAKLVTGGGSTEPTGVVTTSALGKTGSASVSGAFSSDDLIDLFFSVIAPYRNSPKAAWLMRDATLAAVRKFREGSGTGAYLFSPAATVGAPDTLLGKPIYTDPNVAAVALGAKSVLFGDFGSYVTRIAGGIRFERSDEFAFGTDQVTFRCLIRGDGLLVDQTGAVKHFIGNAA